MSEYPVGATWEGKEIDVPDITRNYHRKAKILLYERRNNFEVWYSSWDYSDGSHEPGSRKWNTSYQACKNDLPFNCKMRRIR